MSFKLVQSIDRGPIQSGGFPAGRRCRDTSLPKRRADLFMDTEKIFPCLLKLIFSLAWGFFGLPEFRQDPSNNSAGSLFIASRKNPTLAWGKPYFFERGTPAGQNHRQETGRRAVPGAFWRQERRLSEIADL
jgi:hypothetical protein